MTSDVVNLHTDVESSSLLGPNSTPTSSTCRVLVPNQPPCSEAAIFRPFGSNFSTGNMLWQPGPDRIFQT
ncbi:hypothetical protein LWI29_002332 [Acer saccharum]|uniref:Uncharacterized protein n=1 Tax=Acer saccharum TaxID=4024 RepID=A0AA39SN64_ACESA|nr:hypothetical protein LWI29_002332 [Acer saccharum]